MNTVIGYIGEIRSEHPYKADWTGDEDFVKVRAVINYWGSSRTVEKIYLKSEWEEAKRNGYVKE
ncbi:hypothetical protein [Bacillus thuringiensis]|uniref:hypothetical protein n=1 Tax=Bacillus thuringiensis TaxID=1428 RepID=UPI000BFC3AC4|nr:hypothetical protein [Bacillus thuringiensis]PGT90130.1 hypothetical protein COD17_10295 [Bacillus thuringiensis]